MPFFSRLFSKASGASEKSASQASRRASPSSSDDDDEGEIVSPPAAGTGLFSGPVESLGLTAGRRFGTSDRSAPSGASSRRVGGEIRRSQTYTCSSYTSVQVSARQSMSSCDGSSLDDKLKQQYGKLRQTHLGGTAVILEGVERRSKQPVVVKAYAKAHMTASTREQVEREVSVLRAAAGCPGVVRLMDQVEDVTNMYVVLESAPGSTLIEVMAHSGGRLPEARCVHEVVAPVLRALAALHALGIVHRDIKPEHIMCGAMGSVRLLDLAKAAQKSHQNLNCRVGQLEYMSPEVLSKPTAADIFHQVLAEGMSEGELPQYDEKADVWSLGCVVFEALTGQQPFMAESPTELAALHGAMLSNPGPDGAPLLLQHPCVSKLARSFLTAVLQADPHRRPSAGELLQHPWVTQHASAGGGGFASPSWIPTSHGSASGHSGPHTQQYGQQRQQGGRVGGGGSASGSPATTREPITTATTVSDHSNPNSDESLHSSDSVEALASAATAFGASNHHQTQQQQPQAGRAPVVGGWQPDPAGLAQAKRHQQMQHRSQVAMAGQAGGGARERIPGGYQGLLAKVDVPVR